GVTNFVETIKEINASDVVSKNANTNAQDPQHKEMTVAKERLEQQTVQFIVDTLDLMPGQESTLKGVAATIRILLAAAQFVGQPVQIDVVGHADASGTPLGNQVVGLTRAERVIAELTRNGITQSDLSVLKARGDDVAQGKETPEQQS